MKSSMIYKCFSAAVILTIFALGLITIPQNTVTYTQLNSTLLKYSPIYITYNGTSAMLILPPSLTGSIANLLYSSSNESRAMEYAGLLILNSKPYIAYGVLELYYHNGALTITVYVTSAVPLNYPNIHPQVTSGLINGTYSNSSSVYAGNGTEESTLVNVGPTPIPPYLNGTFPSVGQLQRMRSMGKGAVGLTSTVTSTRAVAVSPPGAIAAYVSLAVIAIALSVLVVVRYVSLGREDCAVRGMRRIVSRLNKALTIYKPDLAIRDIERYVSYFTSDRRLINEVLLGYERRVYGGEDIDCREYNRAVKELLKMIKKL